jgi:aminoglycoside phosphotransferase (APT) family kinase protein
VREWSADVSLEAGLVRRLIRGQFPELDLRSLRLLGEGWDNAVWLVDERWTFRFPRRAIAVAGVQREIAMLPRLAPLLPLPVPTPLFVGRPADGYPWPFFGGPFLPGRELSDAALSHAARVRLGRPLGTFLRALHRPDLDPGPLPVDPNRRSDMAFRVPRALDRLADVEHLGLWRPPPAVAAVLDVARKLPPAGASAVVHGDLHFRHLLVSDEGVAVGVIDWGDVCRGDPSLDLPLFWSSLPSEGRAEFLAAYGSVAEEQLLRGRVLALFLCAALAVYGHQEGMRTVEREAVEGLARAAVD